MSTISRYSERLVARLVDAGMFARRGFMAQFVEDIPTYPFVVLQPGKDSDSKLSRSGVTATRNSSLLIAVPVGRDQEDEMDSAVLATRSALAKDVVGLMRLGDKANEGVFTLGDPEFFIPEGLSHLYVCQMPVTIQYTDQF